MESYKILIVEDEILIADMIERYLVRKGHKVVGSAISYEEATKLYTQEKPDIALLDIRLSGPKTGIDFAAFIQQQDRSIPFIYLTSQMDKTSIDQAKETLPAGYLSKPIQKESLYATIEIAMFNHEKLNGTISNIEITDGLVSYLIPIKDILYLQAEHIYVKVHLEDGRQLMERSTMKDFLEVLPERMFVQTHRSYAVNAKRVSHWDVQSVFVQGNAIPISRSRRKTIISDLKIDKKY